MSIIQKFSSYSAQESLGDLLPIHDIIKAVAVFISGSVAVWAVVIAVSDIRIALTSGKDSIVGH